jgi:hypothetical protein
VKTNKRLLQQSLCYSLTALANVFQHLQENRVPNIRIASHSFGEFYFWISLAFAKNQASTLPDHLIHVNPDDLCWPIRLSTAGHTQDTSPNSDEVRPTDSANAEDWNEFSAGLTFWRLGLAIESLSTVLLLLARGHRCNSTKVQATLEYAIWNVNHAWNGRSLMALPSDEEWSVLGSSPPDIQMSDVLKRLQSEERRAMEFRLDRLAKLQDRLSPESYEDIATLWRTTESYQ